MHSVNNQKKHTKLKELSFLWKIQSSMSYKTFRAFNAEQKTTIYVLEKSEKQTW